MRLPQLTMMVALLYPLQSSAAIVDLGNVTRDTTSGLDWLDLTETTGLSVADVLADAGGFISAGWRYATTAEVCGLYDAFAILSPGNCPGSEGITSHPNVTTFGQLLGLTDPGNLCGFGGAGNPNFDWTFGIYDNSDPGIDGVAWAGRSASPMLGAASVLNTYEPACSGPPPASVVGHHLVRPGPAIVCGDGVIDAGEECDDGGAVPGDGCSATCSLEAGWTCVGEPSACSETCGDNLVVGSEECDDGNTADLDCCSSTCTFQDADPGGLFGGTPNCCSAGACQIGQGCGQVCFLAGICAVVEDQCRCVGVGP